MGETESPTETMNSTVPAANPPNRMLERSVMKSTGHPVSTQQGEQRTTNNERE
jgi:hypothetical protein